MNFRDEINSYSRGIDHDISTMEIILNSFVGSGDKVDQIKDIEDVECDINYVVKRTTKHIDHVRLIKTRYGVQVEFSLIPCNFTLSAYGEQTVDYHD